jgi:hypothetical protein
MTIWHLIYPLFFLSPIAGAAVAAEHATAGPIGWALALSIGSALGGGCVVSVWYGLKALWIHSERSDQDRYLIAATLAVVPLLFLVGLLGETLSSGALQLIG